MGKQPNNKVMIIGGAAVVVILAGAYAIQGVAAAFVPKIIGSYSNVVGLPLAETAALLRGLGIKTG